MDSVHETIILDNKNQITSYEIDTGEVCLGYIFEGTKKKVKIEFDLFEDKECDFVENAFYKNPILKEELINSRLDFHFFEYLLANGIKIIPQSVTELNLAANLCEEEKNFLYDSLRAIIIKNPLLALDIKGFDTDAMKEILSRQLVEVKKEKVDYIPIEDVKVNTERSLPEYYRIKKLYSDEKLKNITIPILLAEVPNAVHNNLRYK